MVSFQSIAVFVELPRATSKPAFSVGAVAAGMSAFKVIILSPKSTVVVFA